MSVRGEQSPTVGLLGSGPPVTFSLGGGDVDEENVRGAFSHKRFLLNQVRICATPFWALPLKFS